MTLCNRADLVYTYLVNRLSFTAVAGRILHDKSAVPRRQAIRLCRSQLLRLKSGKGVFSTPKGL